MNSDIFSVGLPRLLTMGLTAIGFLCNFVKKYSCCVLGGCPSLNVRFSFVTLCIILFLYMSGRNC